MENDFRAPDIDETQSIMELPEEKKDFCIQADEELQHSLEVTERKIKLTWNQLDYYIDEPISRLERLRTGVRETVRTKHVLKDLSGYI